MPPQHSGSDDRADMVLIVEDNEVNRTLALRQLEKLGYPARAVTNGMEALEAVKGSSFGVVLMDCLMPEMDGFQTTRAIREMEAGTGRRTPIIALTANVTDRDREACLEAGMDDFVPKPVMIESLRDALAQWLAPADAEERAATEGAGDGDRGPTILDPSSLRALRDDVGEETVARLVGMYLSNLPTRTVAIRDAVDRGDLKALHLTAHTLKSASAALGASRLAAICEEIEAAARNGATDGLAGAAREIEAESERVRDALSAEPSAPRRSA